MSLSFAAINVLNFLVDQIENDQVIPAKICPQDELSEIHHELMAENLVMKDDRLAANPTFCILPAARASARRLSKRYRQAAIQLEIMSEIEGNPDRGSRMTTTHQRMCAASRLQKTSISERSPI